MYDWFGEQAFRNLAVMRNSEIWSCLIFRSRTSD